MWGLRMNERACKNWHKKITRPDNVIHCSVMANNVKMIQFKMRKLHYYKKKVQPPGRFELRQSIAGGLFSITFKVYTYVSEHHTTFKRFLWTDNQSIVFDRWVFLVIDRQGRCLKLDYRFPPEIAHRGCFDITKVPSGTPSQPSSAEDSKTNGAQDLRCA